MSNNWSRLLAFDDLLHKDLRSSGPFVKLKALTALHEHIHMGQILQDGENVCFMSNFF